MATTQALMVFARYPAPGRVKTRLAAQVGEDLATGLYAAMAAEVWRVALQAQAAGIAQALLFCDAPMGYDCRYWLTGAADYYPQAQGDLGQRLAAGFRDLFRAGYTRVAAVGTDCVALTPNMIQGAFEALVEAEVVLGPSTDGGYYLCAMRRYHRGLFEGIPWATPKVFEATIQRTAQAALPALILPVHTDVDTAEDAMAVLGQPYAERLPAGL
ncbi:MAG TPA: TIGR04282 family arsenosugar biosynthesis glycosyltransferase, partial [bacterium]|nr:TIGR04282 family arsenosugar biosynthesis glycosyltransferase [bacterium]